LKLNYEDYCKQKKQKSKFSKTIKVAIDGFGDIPFIGNTIHSGAKVVSQSVEAEKELEEVIKRERINVKYLVLEADDFYSDLTNKTFQILEITEIQKKYQFSMDDIEVEINEYVDDDWQEFEYRLDILFTDDKYKNNKTGTDEIGLSLIVFQEKFQTVNPNNYKVLAVFEITTTGINHPDSTKNRDYCEIANLIIYLLNNPTLLDNRLGVVKSFLSILGKVIRVIKNIPYFVKKIIKKSNI